MNVQQVNNSQTNFKGGFVALKGVATRILKDMPHLSERVNNGFIKCWSNYDFFVFSEKESELERSVHEWLKSNEQSVIYLPYVTEMNKLLCNIYAKYVLIPVG